MKFIAGETVKISKNNSLFFDATGKFATVEHVNEYDSQRMEKYFMYNIAIKIDGVERIICVEEDEILKV